MKQFFCFFFVFHVSSNLQRMFVEDGLNYYSEIYVARYILTKFEKREIKLSPVQFNF